MLWGLRPVEQQAAYGLAVDRIKRQIHMGFIMPGERLPAERKLAEEVGLSRVTLREALRVLEAEGYITTRRGAHGGAFVAEAIVLDDIAHKRLMLNPSHIMRIIEFREANEASAARLACDRSALPELKRMKAALKDMQTAESGDEFKSALSYFTLSLGDASHNSYIADAIEHGLSQTFLPAKLYGSQELMQSLIAHNQALLAAIESKSPDVAEQEASAILRVIRKLARETLRSV